MGSIHKIGDEYYIEFFARGLKYQQKAGSDRKQAEKLLADVEEKIGRGEMGTMVRDVDVDIFVNDFLGQARGQYAPKTAGRFESTLARFQKFLKTKFPQLEKLSQLTPNVFEQYKRHLQKEAQLSVKTVNLALILLREFCEYGRKTGYLNDNPLLHIKFVPGAYRMPRCLREAELRPFLSSGGGDLLAGLKQALDQRASQVNAALLRNTFAFYALRKNISLVALSTMLALDDVAKAMVYFPFLTAREDENFSSGPYSI